MKIIVHGIYSRYKCNKNNSVYCAKVSKIYLEFCLKNNLRYDKIYRKNTIYNILYYIKSRIKTNCT